MITWKSPEARRLFSLEGLTESGGSDADAGEVDHIPVDRLPALIALMNETHGPVQKYVRNQAAIYLTYWGSEEGIRYIETEISKPPSERPATHLHRMGSFDITPELFTRALIGYWALAFDKGQSDKAKKLIRPALRKIVIAAQTEAFAIDSILKWEVDDYFGPQNLVDENQILRDYLRAMLDQKDDARQDRKPKEAVEFFEKFDPELLDIELKARGLTKRDF